VSLGYITPKAVSTNRGVLTADG